MQVKIIFACRNVKESIKTEMIKEQISRDDYLIEPSDINRHILKYQELTNIMTNYEK